MYMYYLLCYKYFGNLDLMEQFYVPNEKTNDGNYKDGLFIGFGNLLKNIDAKLREKVIIIINLYFMNKYLI